MSYCTNCGFFVGESRFCANCGTAVQSKVNDAAESNQPQVNAYNNQPPVSVTQTVEARSPYYDQIISYHRAVRSYFTCGLLSLILCVGIGSIFQLISFIKTFTLIRYGRLFDYKDVIKNYPREWEILTNARRKHNKGRTMFIIGTALTSVLYIIFFAAMAGGW